MTKFTFKNPLAVNENDNLGTAFVKGAVEGYLKGTLAAGAGLCVLAIIGNTVSKKAKNSKKEEEVELTEEEIEKSFEAAWDEANKQFEVESIK